MTYPNQKGGNAILAMTVITCIIVIVCGLVYLFGGIEQKKGAITAIFAWFAILCFISTASSIGTGRY